MIDERPRGVRNNNPGNVKWTPVNHWVGQIGNDGEFCIFDTPEHGIRVIAILIPNYRLYTVREIITKWSTTDRESYIKNVCDHLKVKPDDYIEPTRSWTMVALVEAIIIQECGKLSYYTPEQIRTGVLMGLSR